MRSGLSGRHFLQTPGPTNVPERVLQAIAQPTIDHRSADFAELVLDILRRLGPVFGTADPIIIYPSSGTGAWEAALVNTLSPGDRVLAFETGHFSTLWRDMAHRFGLVVDFVPGDWRHAINPADVAERLAADKEHQIAAVMVVHNETSTGVTSSIPDIRAAIDAANHPALLLVDTISSLGSIDYQHERWGVDVTIGGSQKGLMLPPGLGFNAVGPKALAARATAKLPKSYWDWSPIIEANSKGFYPYTLPTNLLYGLQEALVMLDEEGLTQVFRRHDRHAAATRAAVRGWGLDVLCADENAYSSSLTAVLLPDAYDADNVRRVVLEHFDMSLGAGLGKLAGRVFRIGHLGGFNDLMLAGTLCGVQMGLGLAGVPVKPVGVQHALDVLTS